ncbi:MAG: hypothetical protein ACYC91_18950 [Solirubrobacteraceae bacterium]
MTDLLAEVDLAEVHLRAQHRRHVEIERSIPFSSSNAWISTSEAPRSRRLNACTTTRALGRSTTSTPSSPRT